MYLVLSVREPDRLGNTVSNKTVKTVVVSSHMCINNPDVGELCK